MYRYYYGMFFAKHLYTVYRIAGKFGKRKTWRICHDRILVRKKLGKFSRAICNTDLKMIWQIFGLSKHRSLTKFTKLSGYVCHQQFATNGHRIY